MNKLQELVREFVSDSKKQKELSQAFQAMKDIQSNIQPDPDFRKHLGMRLESLAEVKAMSHQITTRRFQLFTWVFASFLFLGVFLYYLSATFFYDFISGSNKTIGAPRIQETPIISPEIQEGIQKSVTAPLYDENQWDNSQFQKTSDAVDDELQDTISIQEAAAKGVLIEEWIKEEPAIERTSLEDDDSVEDATPENENSVEEWAVLNFSLPISDEASIVPWDADIEVTDENISQPSSPIESRSIPPTFSDQLWEDTPPIAPERLDFKSYCKSIKGIYVVIAPLKECHRDQQVCSQRDYTESGVCFWESVDSWWGDTEVDLQDLIDQYEE